MFMETIFELNIITISFVVIIIGTIATLFWKRQQLNGNKKSQNQNNRNKNQQHQQQQQQQQQIHRGVKENKKINRTSVTPTIDAIKPRAQKTVIKQQDDKKKQQSKNQPKQQQEVEGKKNSKSKVVKNHPKTEKKQKPEGSKKNKKLIENNENQTQVDAAAGSSSAGAGGEWQTVVAKKQQQKNNNRKQQQQIATDPLIQAVAAAMNKQAREFKMKTPKLPTSTPVAVLASAASAASNKIAAAAPVQELDPESWLPTGESLKATKKRALRE